MRKFDQKEFDEFVIENGVYGFFDEAITLASGRRSHFYANWRNVVEDVFLTDKLADFIIAFLNSKNVGVDTFYGVPDGATKIGLITQFKFAKEVSGFDGGSHVLAMGRKVPKEHGAAKDRFFVGMPRGRVVVIEDVTTTGNSLIKALRNLKKSGVDVVGVVSLTNRMEKRDDKMSVEEAVRSEGFDFYSMNSALDVLPVVGKKIGVSNDVARKIEEEFLRYGVKEIKMVEENVIDRLMDKIDEVESPCIIGLDPQLRFIPSFIREGCLKKFGNTRRGVSETYVEFCKGIIDATYDLVPAFKPNICFYEKYGAEGVEAFEKIVAYVRSKGCVVIEDAKRNEIGSSSQAYAEGHLGEVDMLDGSKARSIDVDIMVVNPYLGSDGLNPFINVCEKFDKGIFILAKTSNPSSGEFQDKFVEVDGEKVELYNLVASKINEYAQKFKGSRGYSFVGAVVGATYPEQAKSLRKLMPNSYFLVPGYGAQGGGGKDLVNCFNDDGYGAVVNSSRGIIYAYRNADDERNYASYARKAIMEMNEDVRGALRVAGKIPKKWKGGIV